ncbi:MAG TPA: tyrosine--tRNA ligase [Candidatus Caccalectryoclostridium excrementigallinarum]|uniref:Tyrosine--tRNA ligase n=1 Tax=Candidatus Caccalectryoclostridium excrementigallinarum TaxID=2840710 RepID=A0A9D1MLE8_9FIRM|nr:tyrosine--tRNA ligase [Candidatus Caccalectryoclostridium excrementigallinarum]
MKNVLDTLKERGYVKQTVYEDELYELLGKESVSFYIGFDPTADSLHVGHFVQLMAMSIMQKAGHRPVILIGGGTGKIGDPSGKSDMRKMMTDETIRHNCECFKKQMSKFLSFEGDNAAVMVNNADWLDDLNYIKFLREVGVYFSVNKMLTAECYKSRMEKGLTFLEFNYMLMQAYDFLHLFRSMGCRLECGGDDQWSNILAGADLIRRKERQSAFAMTFKLLTTSEGKKMGKTEKGALWLDPEKTSPYEFYQYWRNIDDADVENCMKLLTFMPLEEIKSMCEHKDERINAAKARLAFELTAIVHGDEEAKKAQDQSLAAFASSGGELPTAYVPAGVNNIIDIMCAVKAAKSKSEARQLITGGGVKVGEEKITSFDVSFDDDALRAGIVLHKGKKVHIKVLLG